MERLRVEIAPHKKLPPEILVRIFVKSADNEVVYIPPEYTHSVTRALGRVCSRWRKISRAEPKLWRYIEVTDLSSEDALSLLNDVLSHCGGQGKVDISLHPGDDNEWVTTLNLVDKYSLRLRSLHFILNKTCLVPLATPLNVFDKVESLSLTFGGPESILGSDRLPIAAFSNAQSLRKLTLFLSLYQDFTDPTGNMLPWARLTDVTLFQAHGQSAIVILSHGSSLINLKISLPNPNVSSSTNAIVFPHLQSIYISATSHVGNITAILAQLTLPSLKKMGFGLSRAGVMHELAIVRMIERSACNVESFRTDNIAFAVADLIPVLQLMPALTVWDIPINQLIPNSVFSTIMAEKLAPNLRVLQGWRVSSVHLAMNFLNSQRLRTPSGHYEGIQDAMIWMWKHNYTDPDKKYIQSILLQLEREGQSIQFTPY